MRRRAASARQAVTAAPRSGSRVGAGQRSEIAASDAAEASPQPARRSGIEETGPGSATGRMKARSSATVALARTELTTPAKRTPKPTSPIARAPSQGERDTTVPTQMKTAPVAASAACACSRARIGPPKSTSSSSANDPKAAKVATVGFRSTWVPKANMAGMTRAPRPARRSAAIPGSFARSHRSGCIASRIRLRLSAAGAIGFESRCGRARRL